MAEASLFSWHRPKLAHPGKSSYHWIVHFAITLATLLVIISTTGEMVGALQMRGSLAIDVTETMWLNIGYLMMLGIALPVSVYFADAKGYKKTFLIGMILFTVGGTLSGLFQNFWLVLFSRIIEGAGGGFVMPISLALLARIFPQNQLSFAISMYVGVGFGGGIALGYILGGFISYYLDWHYFFLMNFPLGIGGILIILLFFCETEKHPRKFDLPGYIAFAVFLVGALTTLMNVKAPWNTEGWHSTFTKGGFLVTGIGLISLILIDRKHKNPVVDFSLFKFPAFVISSVILIFVGGLLFSTMNVIVEFLQELGYERKSVGLCAAPIGAVMGVLGGLAGIVGKRINERYLALIGMVILMLSAFYALRFSWLNTYPQLLFFLVLMFVGVGFCLGPLTGLGMVGIPEEKISTASALLTFFRQMGGAINSVIIQIIITQRMEFHKVRFGTQVNAASPGFQEVKRKLFSHFFMARGTETQEGEMLAEGAIRANLDMQANIAAFSDAFFIYGIIMALFIVLLSVRLIWAHHQRRKEIAN